MRSVDDVDDVGEDDVDGEFLPPPLPPSPWNEDDEEPNPAGSGGC